MAGRSSEPEAQQERPPGDDTLLAPPAPFADPARDRSGEGGPPTLAVKGIVDTGPNRPVRRRGARARRREAQTPAAAPLRHRVLPRTVLGIASMILAFAIGAAFSGTVLYSYYQYHLDQTDQRVNTLVDGYKGQFRRAEADLRSAATAARSQIEAELEASGRDQTDPAAQQAIVARLARSLFFVTTENTDGQASVGSAFVVASSATQSLLLTSYTTVKAATVTPGPSITVRHGDKGAAIAATLRTWDPGADLALLILPRGNLPAVPVAPSSPAPQLGQPVFAVSGEGAAGASIAAGQVDDVSASGLADDIPIGPAFQGAPIVNSRGEVIAVASLTYAPLGFASSGVWYSPFVGTACRSLLSCPGGRLSASH